MKKNEYTKKNIHPGEEKVSTEMIISWMKNWLSDKLNIDPEQIDPGQSVLSYGLDSLGAVELERDINDKYNLDFFVGDVFENNAIIDLARVGSKNRIITSP